MADDKPEIMMIDRKDTDSRSVAEEKGPVVRNIDNIRVLGLTDDDASFYDAFGADNRKKLLHKVCTLTMVYQKYFFLLY